MVSKIWPETGHMRNLNRLFSSASDNLTQVYFIDLISSTVISNPASLAISIAVSREAAALSFSEG